MSLIDVMARASKFRRTLRKAGSKIGMGGIKKRKSLRGGMWAKKATIGAAYNTEALRAGMAMGAKAGMKGAKSAPYGKAYGYGHALKGQAIGHFAKRYPKTQFAIQSGKVASIGALGAWILNDDDKKA